MPELPEVETVKNGLMPLVGKTFSKTSVHTPKLRWPIPQHLHTQLYGKTICNITRRAKYLCIHLNDDAILLIHLGMSGALYLQNSETPLKKHEHVVFQFANMPKSELRYLDIRRFGSMHLIQSPPHTHRLLCKLGLEPLTDAFSSDFLHTSCQQKKCAIKPLIMNQAIVVGVGNIYASEALFLSKIHPTTLACRLSHTQCQELVAHIKSVLHRAIRLGGTTLKDFVNPDAKPGYFQQTLYVYGRKTLPCRLCQTPIERIELGQRSSFFCPKCQPPPQELTSQ